MSYVHRLTLALKHCWAYLRRISTSLSGPFASRRTGTNSFVSRRSLGTRLRAAWSKACSQARPQIARAQAHAKYAQAQAKFAQAKARQMAGQKFQGLASGSKFTRFLAWLGKSIAYSVALSLALSALVFGIGAAVAGSSWHERPQGFSQLSTVAEIQTSGFDEQDARTPDQLSVQRLLRVH